MANGPMARIVRLVELSVLPGMMEQTQSVSELVMSLARWQCSNSTYCGSRASRAVLRRLRRSTHSFCPIWKLVSRRWRFQDTLMNDRPSW